MTHSIRKIVRDKIVLDDSSVWKASLADSAKLFTWSIGDRVEVTGLSLAVKMTNQRKKETISVSASKLDDPPKQSVSVLRR